MTSSGTLILSRIAGGPITEPEVHALLDRYGAIEWMAPVTVRDQEVHDIPDGVWVKFAYYEDCRDAQIVRRRFPLIRNSC